MAWTYSGNPGTSPRDEVRFLLGDTTNTKQSLTDEEIDYMLTSAGGIALTAAIEGAYALSARHSAISATSKKVGDLQLSYSHGDTAARFEVLAARLRRRSGPRTFLPIVSAETDKAGTFSIGMDDYGD